MFRLWSFILLGILPAFGAEKLIEFSRMKSDEPLKGFQNTVLGSGRPGDWKLLETEVPPILGLNTAKAEVPRQNVLAQVSRDPTDNRYCLLIYDSEDFADFTVETRFKLQAGVVEQMAGIAFRIQNPSNYFYIRASGIYNSLRFVPVVNGAIQAPVGPDIPIEKGVWHELKIQGRGNQFDCWLDGKRAFPTITDATFSAGKIGFWTKSDSVSYFSDTRVAYTPREELATILVRDIKAKYDRLKSIHIVGRRNDGTVQVLASVKPEEIGQPPNQYEKDVLSADKKYVGRNKELKCMVATLPLHDKNGDTIAAVRFELEPFPGQTEKSVLERTMPYIREMEARVAANKELNALR